MSQINVKELGHLVLYVSDIQRSTHFYGEVLGWPRLPMDEGTPVAAFSSGRTHHELLLIEVGDRAQPKSRALQLGLYHFGLKIGDSDDDLKAALARLQAAGVPLTGTADHHVTHSLYITDPDGNEIELYIDVPGVDWKHHPELIAAPVKPLNLN